MELFLKACGAVLLAVILILAQKNMSKDLPMVLGVCICCMVALTAMEYLRPVMDFLDQLEQLGGLNHNLVRILLKSVGIGLITEITALVCADAGHSSLGKTVQLLGAAVILWLSLPAFTMLIELLQRVLGAV